MDAFKAFLDENPALGPLIGLLLLFCAAALAAVVARRALVAGAARIVRGTKASWDDVLVEKRVFFWLANLVPAVVLYAGVAVTPGVPEALALVVQRASATAAVAVGIVVLNALLQTANEVYARSPAAKHRPLKGYVQIVQIFLFVTGAVVLVATAIGQSPWVLLSGIGALTAVLLLVFKDTILSLVASVQLTSNDMIRVGDWIELPEQGADGDVVDIALHTVKVQNWDKTITTIPTYTLISTGFKNWRTMPLSGGRRIKRPVFVDVSSVRHLDDAEIERFSRFVLLQDYIRRKCEELKAYNAVHCKDPGFVANARRLTNLGTFRAYLERYLRGRPDVNQDLTLMVRHLAPTPHGLPVEIYCFTNRTEWPVYEGIQADIFDHVLAIAPEFGLRVYQQPSGADLRGALSSAAHG